MAEPLLVMTGIASAAAISNDTSSESPRPLALAAATQMRCIPAEVGLPVIAPLAPSNDRPAGSVPLVRTKEVGEFVAVSVVVRASPTRPRTIGELETTGALVAGLTAMI